VNQPKVKYSLSNWDLVTVNPNYKTWNWKDLFCFWGANVQSVIGFSLISSLYLMYSLNVFVVFFGIILGSFFVYLFSNAIGKPSQKFGLPFAVLLRSSLGFNGAKLFGLIRSLVGIFLFGIQTYFLSKIIVYLIRITIFSIDNSLLEQEIFIIFYFGLNIIDWFAIVITIVLQTLFFTVGMQYNKKIINFSAMTVYAGMLIFFFVVLLSDVKITTQAFSNIFSLNSFLDVNNLAPLLTVAGTIFAYFSILIISFGDFSREIIFSFPVFPFILIGSLLIRYILEKTKNTEFISNILQREIGILSTDLLIFTAMASLDIAVVFDNWILILVFTIFGLFWNLICIAYFAYFIFDDYWFEKSLIEFGNSTGVVASGLLLLRLADPKNISKTLPIFTSKQLFAQLILSGGLFTVLAPLMISKIGLDYWTEICALITLAILFIALIFNKVEMKKFQ